jgi:hypothetical protein
MNNRIRLSSIAILVRITGALLLAGLGAAHGNQSPATQAFATELDAVVAAASYYNPVSVREDREFMGAVLRDGDRYEFTVSAGEPGQDAITARIPIRPGVDIVAFWHTHGARTPSNEYFSAVDTRLVKRWQKPFYLADYTGVLKVMVPGGRTLSAIRARQLGLPARAGYAVGQVVNDASGNPVRINTEAVVRLSER